MVKTALITGASGGIGLELAKVFAKEGYNLVLVARSEGKLYKIKTELENEHNIKVNVFAQDLSVVDAAYEVFNYCLTEKIQVDVLVNNAGFGDNGNFAEADWQKQYEMIQVNIVALMQLTKYFVTPMIEHGYGKILNLSSVAAFCAGPEMSVYYASKEYVRCFSEALSEELKGTGVTVTALCPGPTLTGFENAAGMKKSKMFSHAKANSAKRVAQAGYKALMKGKPLKYHGITTNVFNIAARIVPRSISRKVAKRVNR